MLFYRFHFAQFAKYLQAAWLCRESNGLLLYLFIYQISSSFLSFQSSSWIHPSKSQVAIYHLLVTSSVAVSKPETPKWWKPNQRHRAVHRGTFPTTAGGLSSPPRWVVAKVSMAQQFASLNRWEPMPWKLANFHLQMSNGWGGWGTPRRGWRLWLLWMFLGGGRNIWRGRYRSS